MEYLKNVTGDRRTSVQKWTFSFSKIFVIHFNEYPRKNRHNQYEQWNNWSVTMNFRDQRIVHQGAPNQAQDNDWIIQGIISIGILFSVPVQTNSPWTPDITETRVVVNIQQVVQKKHNYTNFLVHKHALFGTGNLRDVAVNIGLSMFSENFAPLKRPTNSLTLFCSTERYSAHSVLTSAHLKRSELFWSSSASLLGCLIIFKVYFLSHARDSLTPARLVHLSKTQIFQAHEDCGDGCGNGFVKIFLFWSVLIEDTLPLQRRFLNSEYPVQ